MQIDQTFESEVIAALNKDVHEVHVSLYPDYFKEYHFESVNVFFKKIISNPNFYFYVIKENETNLGYAWIEIKEYQENAFMKAYKSIFVHQLSISTEYRNKGLGVKLMDKINEVAKENNIRKIELDYWTDNEAAQRFYEKLGFKGYREFVYKYLE
ncbi:GNAT family N-acetyltransferase [Cohnella cholangitidis]|uniref:GNAT family N-acetyltransferase n=1 Tax=Cohnella cholangitidis TaxID=2598458 RepID=A0A7G5BSV1_9BACL|nr:GNAT family N-acetyltransferase [Cohnella cholangitidis]QMV40035.1 GNAT family N-acetyltransferase [Cohnella cholangitidis]